MLTISVKNFGPIAEGSVDLKPLTIFVGPSNTGKSYMATAVYAVMQGFEGPYHWSYRIRPQPDEQGRTPLQWQATSGRLLMARGAGSDAADALLKWAAQLPKDKLITREIFSSDLPQDLWAEVEHSILVMLDIIAQEAIARISDTYGDPSSFVRREIGNEDFCVNLYRHEPLLSLDIQLDSNGKLSPDFDISRIPIRQPNLGPMLERETSDSNSETYVRSGSMSFLMLLDSATEPLFDKLPPQTLYLPASRSGLIQVYKVLSAAIVRQSSAVRVHNPDRSTLPGTTTDFLSNLLSLDDRGSTEEDDDYLQNAIGFIETAVLQGKIILDKSGWLPYPEITYESETGKFALNQTSSMVSELAPAESCFSSTSYSPRRPAHTRGAGVSTCTRRRSGSWRGASCGW